MKLRHSKLPLALGLVLLSSQAHALGLGQIEVKSGLNQPLLAEIPILSATSEELESLEVRLASPEAFARVGLERPYGLAANLEMTLSHNANGQPVVRVTTSNKFNEPFLTFLLEASWGKGGVVREFSALVDPPYIAPAIIRPMEMPAVASTPTPELPPAATTAPEPRPSMEAETLAVEEPAPAPVIATPVEPEPAPVIAATPAVATPEPAPLPPAKPVPPPQPIAEAKPSPPPQAAPPPPPPPQPLAAPKPMPASPDDSFGPVSAGQTLWSIAERTRPDAAITVNQMMLALQRANPDAFIGNNINQLKRGAILRIPPPSDITSLAANEAALLVREQANAWQAKRTPSPQPATALEAPRSAAVKPAGKPASQARLAIVPPAGDSAASRSVQSGASSAGGGTELRAELSQTKAQLSQAKEDLSAREAEVRELTSRVADLEQQQADRQKLIDLQNSQLKAMQDRLAQLEAEKAAAAAAATTAPAGVEVPAAEPTAPEPTEPAAAVAAAPVEAEPTSAEVPVPTATPPAPDAAEPFYLNPLVWGGGALALLLGGWLALRGRRTAAPAAAPPRRISEDDALKATLQKHAAESPVAVPQAPLAQADLAADDVADEPVAAELSSYEPEASSEATADAPEAALRAALDERPDSLDAHLALLRHLHAKGNALAFESAAAEMHAHVRTDMDPQWREVVVMGVSLAPRNPLFNAGSWNVPRFAQPAEATPAAPEWREADTLQRQAVPDTVGLTDPSPSEAAPASVEAAASLPFETAEEDWDRLTAGLPVEPEDSQAAFDIAQLDNSPDIHRVEAEVMGEDEGSATKIELAKAYLEIGDADGARAMLEEVVSEGGPAARAEAERLLREIG